MCFVDGHARSLYGKGTAVTHTLKVALVGLLTMAALGCQSQKHVFLTEYRIETIEKKEGVTPAARHVHVLLADYTVSPRQRMPMLSLGAGDALGRQMFQRYATFVWQQQHDEASPVLVRADADTAQSDGAM